jgi:hypothetical protein
MNGPAPLMTSLMFRPRRPYFSQCAAAHSFRRGLRFTTLRASGNG